jgi:hypothetical protein
VTQMVRVGRHEVALMPPIVLDGPTGARVPCCAKRARLRAGALRQHVKCPSCGFPWMVTRKKKGFDWAPDHSAMDQGLPDGMSEAEGDALAELVAAILSPALEGARAPKSGRASRRPTAGQARVKPQPSPSGASDLAARGR